MSSGKPKMSKSRNKKARGAKFKKDSAGDKNHLNAGNHRPSRAGGAGQIRRLIAGGSYKEAVRKAKQYHKMTGTQESEATLVDAYVARIREMLDKGLSVEAKVLQELVIDRFASARDRLAEINAANSIRNGTIDELVHHLCDPETTQDKRAAIEDMIKRELTDLGVLIRCKSLPADHPLKTGAAALAKAFAVVTSGPVSDEAIALPDVSRKSPLAPWKMFIRAIACFYRHDDENCEKCLGAVDPESAPARLVPVIRAIISGKHNGRYKLNTAILIEQVNGNKREVRDSLQKLESILAGKKLSKIFDAVRDTINLCQQTAPELLERLRQHVSIRLWLSDIDDKPVKKAMGGASLKNSYFWHLFAHAAETRGHVFFACALWEEFRKHAVHEGLFPDKGQEVSVLYLHMADLLQGFPDDDFKSTRQDFMRKFSGFGSYYKGQPSSVKKAVKKVPGVHPGMYYIYPERLYGRADRINPHPDTFRGHLEWLRKNDSHWKEKDEVALAWHDEIPDDTEPLLYLVGSARQRSALKKALGFLDKAERIDALSPNVRRARLQLLAATAIRHLKQKKTHLAKTDFREIEALPQLREGNRPAFLASLRSVCSIIDRQESDADRLDNELVRLLGDRLSATVVMRGMLKACGVPENGRPLLSITKGQLKGEEFIDAVGRGCMLGDDIGVPFSIPSECEKQMTDFFSARKCTLDTILLRSITDAALRAKKMELAYAASGAGLLRGGADSARFLLLRVHSLPNWTWDRRNECIAAAIELARRERDMDLIDEAVELQRKGKGSPYGLSVWDVMLNGSAHSIDDIKPDQILQRERDERQYPSYTEHFHDEPYEDDEDHDCRNCDIEDCADRKAEYAPDVFDDHQDDDYLEDLPELPEDMPPEMLPLIVELLLKHTGADGRLPSLEELARKEPELMEEMMGIFLDSQSGGALPGFGARRSSGPGANSRKSRQKKRKKKRLL